ncbi:MAG: hypothetical protein ACN6P1_20025 [Pseudomonas sp.]|uniref:hypothetical protein n=1 Tax=Pseudomonas sp. TaxID=306 RepID=UPI003D0C1970
MMHSHALNPSARTIRATAHKAMAFAALRAPSSLAVRLTRYNHHIQRARELTAPTTKTAEDILSARLLLIEQAKTSDLLHHHWSAAFGAVAALRDSALIGLEHYRTLLARIDATAEARISELEEVCHG